MEILIMVIGLTIGGMLCRMMCGSKQTPPKQQRITPPQLSEDEQMLKLLAHY